MLYIKKAEDIFNSCLLVYECPEKSKLLALEFINEKIETIKEEYIKDFWKLALNYIKTK